MRLSKLSTEMMEDILDEMRVSNFKVVNSALLLGGTHVSANSPLGEYLKPFEIEDRDISEYVLDRLNTLSKNVNSNSEIAQATETVFIDSDGEELRIDIDKDVSLVLDKLKELIKAFSLEKVDPIHFTVAMFLADNEEIKLLLNFFDVNYTNAKRYFKPSKILASSIIPFELSSFLSLVNDKIDVDKPCEILMRDKETDSIWNIMLKKNKRNAIIVGEAGVGKTALVEKITYEIKKGISPKEFKDFQVISLDVNSLIAGTSYRGDAEERIKSLIDFLKDNANVILFIDEVHTILGAGSCFEGEMDLANALKPILARGDTIVIGATTAEEYEKYFKRDAALSRRFEKVEVKEPLSKDVYPMIKNKIQSLSEFHGVKIKRPMVDYLIMIASCFAFEKKNPDKTLDLIDRAMVSAKRANKKWVDKASILKNFAISFEMWDKMSEDSKKEIAYHEVGHYIVGKVSNHVTDIKFLAVSIMPAEDYLGVTVHETNPDIVACRDYHYYIDSMARNLAGRVAENVFTKSYSSGAYEDLQTATKIAFTLVTKLGMSNTSINNRIYLDAEHYPMFSEKAINEVNDEINKVIQEAFERATELIESNKDILEALVDALLKNLIMSESQLDRIWKDVVSKRKQN